MEYTTEQINEHINKFTPVYKNGKTVNPMPNNVKVTARYEFTNDEGFVCNLTKDEMGLTALVVKSWIFEDDLQKLLKS